MVDNIFATPGHNIKRILIIKEGKIIIDVSS